MISEAQRNIDFILQLPQVCAGMKAATIESNLLILARIAEDRARFADLWPEAEMALATVQSALAAMRDAAVEREGGRGRG